MRARTKSFEFSSVTPPPQSNPELELTAKAMLIGNVYFQEQASPPKPAGRRPRRSTAESIPA